MLCAEYYNFKAQVCGIHCFVTYRVIQKLSQTEDIYLLGK